MSSIQWTVHYLLLMKVGPNSVNNSASSIPRCSSFSPHLSLCGGRLLVSVNRTSTRVVVSNGTYSILSFSKERANRRDFKDISRPLDIA